MKNETKHKLYGAILGDLCGQPMELKKYSGDVIIHNPDSHITDDTVLTLATAYAILNNITFESAYKKFGKLYTDDGNGLGYGSNFKEWIYRPIGELNNSYGNGCLMRMSPIIYAGMSESDIDMMIGASCYNSHAHVDSYDTCLKLKDLYLNGDVPTFEVDGVEKFKKFEVTVKPTYDFIYQLFCNAVQMNMSLSECILKAVSCGGDTDTNASIIGELWNCYSNSISDDDVNYVEEKLLSVDPFLLETLKKFNEKY